MHFTTRQCTPFQLLPYNSGFISAVTAGMYMCWHTT
jgi:hypothetical protein